MRFTSGGRRFWRQGRRERARTRTQGQQGRKEEAGTVQGEEGKRKEWFCLELVKNAEERHRGK